MCDEWPVIMLSGMGADARVFARQIEAIPQMSVPAWIEPRPRESMASYAKRFAEKIDPGRPCIVGGASFGGFVALEMLPYLDAKACILVGSVRSSDEFPSHFKALRKSACAAGVIPFEVASLLSRAALLSSGALSRACLKDLLSQMSETDATFLRWACRAVLEWDYAPATDVPIHQIHGAKDFVLPPKNTHPDTIVAGAGHALSMSHPDEVTQFILKVKRPFLAA